MNERVTTDKLREGDIVLNSGMRILIDGPAKVHQRDDLPVYSWPGAVTNADEVCAEDGYVRSFLRGVNKPLNDAEDRWDIVGNRLALWHVERG